MKFRKKIGFFRRRFYTSLRIGKKIYKKFLVIHHIKISRKIYFHKYRTVGKKKANY